MKYAHKNGLWIRFYTLNGASPDADAQNGWELSYDFGSLQRARDRWDAAFQAGVDYIATDQYEELAKVRARFIARPSLLSRPGSI